MMKLSLFNILVRSIHYVDINVILWCVYNSLMSDGISSPLCLLPNSWNVVPRFQGFI